MAYGFRVYECPVCAERVHGGRYVRYGPFSVHPQCQPVCGLCRQVVERPPIGSQHTVAAWCGHVVHASCKERQ